MSNPASASIYSVDSSSLMDWQGRYFPTDVFPGLTVRIEELITIDRFISPALVKEEIGVVGTAGLIE